MKKKTILDELFDWQYSEEDEFLKFAKLFAVTFTLMLGALLLPIWIIPYLIYKKVAER